MSTALYYTIVTTPRRIGDMDLKNSLKKRYTLPHTFTDSDLEFLEGLQAAGIEGTEQLIHLIVNNDLGVEIWEDS